MYVIFVREVRIIARFMRTIFFKGGAKMHSETKFDRLLENDGQARRFFLSLPSTLRERFGSSNIGSFKALMKAVRFCETTDEQPETVAHVASLGENTGMIPRGDDLSPQVRANYERLSQ